MKCYMLCVWLLALVAGAAKSNAPGGPVSKVTALLEDLRDKIDKDGETDEANYEKDECWCKQVEKEKTDMIAKAATEITKLQGEIDSGKAAVVVLEQEIEKDEEDLAKNRESQKSGSATRKKEAKRVEAESTDNEELLKSLRLASKLLSQRKEPASFVQLASDAKKYTPASDNVMGILANQYETTAADQEQMMKAESSSASNFDGWSTDMREQEELLVDDKTKRENDKVATNVEIAEDQEMKDNTVEQKKADAAFLAEAMESCAARQEAYLNRTTLRNEELGGVNQALEILESKRELLSKTFKKVEVPSFLQLSSSSQSDLAALRARAREAHSLRLATVVTQVQEALPDGAFDTVLTEIAEMMTKIKEEAESDNKKKDHCKTEYQTVSRKSKKLTFLIQKNEAVIEKMEGRIEQLEDEKAAAQTDVAETDSALNQSLTLRLAEHAAFQQAKADDELAISVIGETRAALSEYYDKHTGGDADAEAALIQASPDNMSAHRKKLKNSEHKYTLSGADSNKGAATKVLALIDRIVDNLKDEIADGKEDENDAQLKYEKSQDLMLATKDKLQKKIADIGEMISKHGGSKTSEESVKEDNEGSLQAQQDYRASIQAECDWLLEKFDERVAKRESEMDGLTRAKELLSGASFVQEKEATPHQQLTQPLAVMEQQAAAPQEQPEVEQKAAAPQEQPEAVVEQKADTSSLMNYLGLR